ncbi:MAG: hypothetical protein AAFW46_17295 [Pseudomonadota bacterium]
MQAQSEALDRLLDPRGSLRGDLRRELRAHEQFELRDGLPLGARLLPLRPLLDAGAARVADEMAHRRLAVRIETDQDKSAFVDPPALSAVVAHLLIETAAVSPEGETLYLACRCGGPGVSMIRVSDSGCVAAARAVEPAVEMATCRTILSAVGGGLSRIKRPDGGAVHWLSIPDARVESGVEGDRAPGAGAGCEAVSAQARADARKL